jgi:hypothetical protein
MKKLILSALLGMLFIVGCEKSIQSTEEIIQDEQSVTEIEETEVEKVYAYHLDNMEGTTICNPVTAEMLNSYSSKNSNGLIADSFKSAGNFTTQNGMKFSFTASASEGGVNGVGSLDIGDDNGLHLRYNINSIAASGNRVIFQGIITKSVNFSEKYDVGYSIIFNLEDKGSDKIDRYNAAIYTFSSDMDRSFYDSQAWMNCGTDCFPEEYYLDIETGEFAIE